MIKEVALKEIELANEGGRNANLRGASLCGADLRSADLCDASLPSSTTVLLATWGSLSDELTLEGMRYDAYNHPDPYAFDRWADGG